MNRCGANSDIRLTRRNQLVHRIDTDGPPERPTSASGAGC